MTFNFLSSLLCFYVIRWKSSWLPLNCRWLLHRCFLNPLWTNYRRRTQPKSSLSQSICQRLVEFLKYTFYLANVACEYDRLTFLFWILYWGPRLPWVYIRTHGLLNNAKQTGGTRLLLHRRPGEGLWADDFQLSQIQLQGHFVPQDGLTAEGSGGSRSASRSEAVSEHRPWPQHWHASAWGTEQTRLLSVHMGGWWAEKWVVLFPKHSINSALVRNVHALMTMIVMVIIFSVELLYTLNF